jgi:2-dehydro-3-deoxyphosphogluconate aldolase / (4S)-4-hydroxy-2-oxoglutarate aldolase
MSYMDSFYENVEKMGVVPVVVLDKAEDAKPLAEVLVEGGLPSAEVTFRTDAAAESIKIMADECPDIMAGAGTVLTVEQAKRAVDAGAKFIVSPGYNMDVVEWCLDNKVPDHSGGCHPDRGHRSCEQGPRGHEVLPGCPVWRPCHDQGAGLRLCGP